MTTTHWYVNGLSGLALGELDLVSDDLYVALFRPDHTPDNLNHVTYDEIVDDEQVEAGYDAGGKPVLNRAWGIQGGKVVLDADPVSWLGVTWTGFQYAMVYDTTVNNRLVAFVDFESTIARTNQSANLVWAGGLLVLDTQGVV